MDAATIWQSVYMKIILNQQNFDVKINKKSKKTCI